jgi:hypothetical protein
MKRAPGLYEVLLTDSLKGELTALDERLSPLPEPLRPAETADRIALHVSQLVKRAIAGVQTDRVATGVALARRLLAKVEELITDSGVAADAPIEPGTMLSAVLGRRPDGTLDHIDAPLIPLLDTVLLTNAPGEPRVGNQVLTEIHSADLSTYRHNPFTSRICSTLGHFAASNVGLATSTLMARARDTATLSRFLL